MREIKFRGKHIDTDEWVFGCLVVDEPTERSFIWGKGQVFPETAGQYINQVDRNLKKIYEDDILQDAQGRKYCVRWSDGNCGFIAEPIQKSRIWPNLNSGSTKYLEVIGNIFDNPELLRGE